MRSFVLLLLAPLLLGAVDLDLGLPPQPDLDLPILPEHYDPTKKPPEPPKSDTGDDPRDEPGPVFYGEEIESENDTICYVVDLSGSMRRFGRIERARRELEKSINGLSPNVRFNVVAYACSVKSWKPGLVPASEANKAAAIAWTAALQPSGGTGTGPATALALNDKQCQAVALLTDGAPNCGADDAEAHRKMINTANSQRATVNVFGVDAAGPYRDFCLDIAGDSGGSYYDVP
jgi:hypothetical protein